MLSTGLLQTELVASKLVTANKHFPSSERFKGGEKKKNPYFYLV